MTLSAASGQRGGEISTLTVGGADAAGPADSAYRVSKAQATIRL